MAYAYEEAFFDFVDSSARKSASAFIERIVKVLFAADAGPKSVVDFGCGRGVWAQEWLRHGIPKVLGVDGQYVSVERLVVPRSHFLAADLSKPFNVGSRFDVVQCLEVAEHIPPESSDALVESLVLHGNLVIFSAATPGQGGEHHVNERPHSFWRAKFAGHGYRLYDAIRPIIANCSEIEPWYRYNTFVFASAAGAARLSAEARAALIESKKAIPSFAPIGWRIRCRVLAQVPRPVTDALARVKHRLVNSFSPQERN